MLGRDTKWRQGSVLIDKDAHALNLVDSLQSGKRVIVISHDCDLANGGEAFVEVIVGSVVPKPDPLLIGARNPRRLHLRFSTKLSESTCIELRHADKHQVDKRALATLQSQDASFVLSTEEKRSLKQWLAARYGRSAFPNAFEQRLRKEFKQRTVARQIEKTFEGLTQEGILALFFDLGEEREVELATGVPYFLSITVVYHAEEGGTNARIVAENSAEEIKTLFHSAYGLPHSATDIALERCTAVADTQVTLADVRKVDQWRLEYISLREDTPGDFIATGTLSV